ncbi:MAG: hypothetical protein RLZZ574_1302 [Cyanobacteriota bacterium]|jgi:hypothetical protein
MSEHEDWYETRYPNGASEYYRQQYLATKQPEWERLKQERKQRKTAAKESAILIFAEWGIEYEEINPTLWLLNFEGDMIYFYPTTNRWRVKGKKITYYSRNALDFLEKVYCHRNQDEYL